MTERVINDVILIVESNPCFGVNSEALRTLDKITAGNPELRRKLTSVISKTLEIIIELRELPKRRQMFWELYWAMRQPQIMETYPGDVGDYLCNHIVAMKGHMFGEPK